MTFTISKKVVAIVIGIVVLITGIGIGIASQTKVNPNEETVSTTEVAPTQDTQNTQVEQPTQALNGVNRTDCNNLTKIAEGVLTQNEDAVSYLIDYGTAYGINSPYVVGFNMKDDTQIIMLVDYNLEITQTYTIDKNGNMIEVPDSDI